MPEEQTEAFKKAFRRISPQSELDLTLMTTNSLWGMPDVSEELKTRLNKLYRTKTEEGKESAIIESLWGLLGYYTRDMRLGNLSTMNGELEYCKYHLDLAGDFLQSNMIEPFLIALSRVATVLELSQSKGGFLRKKQNTFTHEQLSGEIEPPKSKLFGMKKKEGTK